MTTIISTNLVESSRVQSGMESEILTWSSFLGPEGYINAYWKCTGYLFVLLTRVFYITVCLLTFEFKL
jgi:hypothetical protein